MRKKSGAYHSQLHIGLTTSCLYSTSAKNSFIENIFQLPNKTPKISTVYTVLYFFKSGVISKLHFPSGSDIETMLDGVDAMLDKGWDKIVSILHFAG